MSGDILLGVDVGTSQTKVGAFDLEGRLLSSSNRGYPLLADSEDDSAVQDPEDWWEGAAAGIRDVVGQVGANRLLGVCVGGQGPTVVALDSNLESVHPALTWMDLRATAESARLAEGGVQLPPHFFIPKVMWLKANRPEAYAAAKVFCQAWDFVAARLMGKLAVSSSPGIAPWTESLIEAGNLDPGKFPDQHPMGSVLGAVGRKGAQQTGLVEGTPVVGGISDFFEGLIGSGALSLGAACDNGGTSQGFSVCWDTSLEAKGLLNVPSFVEGKWYIGGPVSTTGKALDWWLGEVLQRDPGDYSALEEAGNVPPGSDRLIFLPYLAGERAPIWDPQARGAFVGLSLGHGQAHLTRAVLESVAFAICDLIDHFETAGGEVHEIRVCGGQARSEIWCQIKADATGRRVILPEVIEAPMLGAAIIAAVGLGAFESYASGAENMVRARRAIEPDEASRSRYGEMFDIYRALYSSLQPLYGRLKKIT